MASWLRCLVALLLSLTLLGCVQPQSDVYYFKDVNANATNTNISVLDLNDTPDSYSGQANKFLTVLPGENGVGFSSITLPGDTNCAALSSCANVLYKNTDINTHDVNATLLISQVPGGKKFIYGNNSGVQVGSVTTCIFDSDLIPGQCDGVQFYIGDTNYGNSVGLTLANNPSFLAFLGLTNINGVVWSAAGTLPEASEIPITARNSVLKQALLADGVFLYEFNMDQNRWVQVGSHQSNSSPDYNLNNVQIRNDLNVLNDLKVSDDVNVLGSLDVDQNIFGQVITPTAGATTTCTTVCDVFDGNPTGSNWSCIFAASIGGIATTCSDISLTRSCMCKN